MFSSLSKPFVEAWLLLSEEALVLFGFIVLIGIIGEIRADPQKKVRFSKKSLAVFDECENLRPKIPQSIWKRQKPIFVALVAFGILGEFFCDGGIFFFGERLQAISDRENSVLQTQASANELTAKLLEIRLTETKTELAAAEARLAELQPGKLPITTISAKLFLSLGMRLKDTRRVSRIESDGSAKLDITINPASLFDLHGKSFTFDADHLRIDDLNDVVVDVSADFRLVPNRPPSGGIPAPQLFGQPANLIDEIDSVELKVFKNPIEATVFHEYVDISFNSLIRRIWMSAPFSEQFTNNIKKTGLSRRNAAIRKQK